MTGHQINALLWATELAIDDQRQYLDYGSPRLDYGDEWPETVQAKAALLKDLADAVQSFGATALAESAEQLAKDFENS